MSGTSKSSFQKNGCKISSKITSVGLRGDDSSLKTDVFFTLVAFNLSISDSETYFHFCRIELKTTQEKCG